MMIVAGTLGFALSLFYLASVLQRPTVIAAMERKRGVVANLGLTDLALFTEARYTRNPSQTDLVTAFQDHPVALERFPTGMLVPAPMRAKSPGGPGGEGKP